MDDSPIIHALKNAAHAIKAANEQARDQRQRAETYRAALLAVLADVDDDPDKVRGVTIKTIEIVRKAVEQ